MTSPAEETTTALRRLLDHAHHSAFLVQRELSHHHSDYLSTGSQDALDKSLECLWILMQLCAAVNAVKLWWKRMHFEMLRFVENPIFGADIERMQPILDQLFLRMKHKYDRLTNWIDHLADFTEADMSHLRGQEACVYLRLEDVYEQFENVFELLNDAGEDVADEQALILINASILYTLGARQEQLRNALLMASRPSIRPTIPVPVNEGRFPRRCRRVMAFVRSRVGTASDEGGTDESQMEAAIDEGGTDASQIEAAIDEGGTDEPEITFDEVVSRIEAAIAGGMDIEDLLCDEVLDSLDSLGSEQGNIPYIDHERGEDDDDGDESQIEAAIDEGGTDESQIEASIDEGGTDESQIEAAIDEGGTDESQIEAAVDEGGTDEPQITFDELVSQIQAAIAGGIDLEDFFREALDSLDSLGSEQGYIDHQHGEDDDDGDESRMEAAIDGGGTDESQIEAAIGEGGTDESQIEAAIDEGGTDESQIEAAIDEGATDEPQITFDELVSQIEAAIAGGIDVEDFFHEALDSLDSLGSEQGYIDHQHGEDDDNGGP